MYPEIEIKRIFFKSINCNLRGSPTNCLLYVDDLDTFNYKQRNILFPMVDRFKRCVISFTNQNNLISVLERLDFDDLLIHNETA